MIVDARLACGRFRSRAEWSGAATALAEAGVSSLVLVASEGPQDAPSRYEPTTLAAFVAAAAPDLRVVAGDTARHGFPYNVARRLATLDHLADGRASWLVEPFPAAEADRSAEFVDVVLKLWLSWEPGAEAADKAARTFHDDTRIHDVDHRGVHFSVLGPLDVPATPQGRPGIRMGVASRIDASLAGRVADTAVVTSSGPQGDFDPARISELVEVVRSAAAAAGRAQAPSLMLGVSGNQLVRENEHGAVLGLLKAIALDGVEVAPVEQSMTTLVALIERLAS